MFKFKLNIMGRVTAAAIAVLTVACVVSLVTLGIRGLRPELYEKQEALESVSSEAALGATWDFGENYVGSMVFLCDNTLSTMSEVEGLSESVALPTVWSDEEGHLLLGASISKTEILFPEAERTAYVTDAVAEMKPDYLLITVGLENGVRYCTEEQFKAYYNSLVTAIKEASPTTKIILNSILPVSKNYERDTKGVSMDKINAANGWIVSIAEEQDVRYLHSISALKNSDGYLDQKYDFGDGLHLNAEGYNALFNYIRTHGYMQKASPEE